MNIFGDDATVIVIIVAIFGLVLIICMCLLFIYCIKKSNNERYNKDLKMGNNELDFINKGNNTVTQLTTVTTICGNIVDSNDVSPLPSVEPITPVISVGTTQNGHSSQRELFPNKSDEIVHDIGEKDEDEDDHDNDDLYAYPQEGKDIASETGGTTKGSTKGKFSD